MDNFDFRKFIMDTFEGNIVEVTKDNMEQIPDSKNSQPIAEMFSLSSGKSFLLFGNEEETRYQK